MAKVANKKNIDNSQFSAYLFYSMAKFDKSLLDIVPERYRSYFKTPQKMLEFCTKKSFDEQLTLLSILGKKVVLQIHENKSDVISETKRLALKYFNKDYDGLFNDIIDLNVYFTNSNKISVLSNSIADLNNSKNYLHRLDFEKLKLDSRALRNAASELSERTKVDNIDILNNFSAILSNVFQSLDKPRMLFGMKREDLFVLFLLLSNYNKWLTEQYIKDKLYIDSNFVRQIKSALGRMEVWGYARKEILQEKKYQITAKGINVAVKIIEDLTRK